jgi:hypothetical protein
MRDRRNNPPNSSWGVSWTDLTLSETLVDEASVKVATPSTKHQSPLLISGIRYRPAAWPRDVVVPTVHHQTQRRHPTTALHRWHHGGREQQRGRIWSGSPYQTLSATRSLCQRPYCGSPALRRGIRSNRRCNSGPHPQPLSTTEPS